MNKVLMVPVHIDALYLNVSEPAAEPTADFRGLPYYSSDERRDVNSDTPWLGETVVSPPFENSNLTLRAGVHLHWSLPDGLRHGQVVNGTVDMPTVPNRWLIRRRSMLGKDGMLIEEQSWVVESDYLWPKTNQAPAVNIFSPESSTDIPYRFLGRKLTWQDWVATKADNINGFDDSGQSEYLRKLTALGYGEPTFAAYYPNCLSVFGFHDRDLPEGWETAQYDLIGWYEGMASPPRLSWEAEANNTALKIESILHWQVESAQVPQIFFCYGSVNVSSKGSVESQSTSSADNNLKIALGNTVSEALAALLANEVADTLIEEHADSQKEAVHGQIRDNFVRQIEEQLEALHIEGQLGSEVQDLGLRLRRYRHQKSFEPVPSYPRWTIQADPPEVSVLPEAVLTALYDLNKAQQHYGQYLSQLKQSRRQLYGDWCNYMRCVYRSPDGGRGQYLNIDEIVAYIKTKSLAAVSQLEEKVNAAQHELMQARTLLDERLLRLNIQEREAKTGHDSHSELPKQPVQYRLKSIPGVRFWQPAEPVVLIAGDNVQQQYHALPNGKTIDDYLYCQIYTREQNDSNAESTGDGILISDRDRILQWIVDNPPNLQEDQAQSSWHPLFLDWGIDMHPSESHDPSAVGRYDSDIITDNYQLGSQYPDLQHKNLWTYDNPDRFSGRCIISETPALVLRERIEDFLERRLLYRLEEIWRGRNLDEPGERTYINNLLLPWEKPESNSAKQQVIIAPESFQKLVQSWANYQPDAKKEIDDVNERKYLSRLLTWYQTLAKEHTAVPLDGLPKTRGALDALFAWYRLRPLREGSSRSNDPIFCVLLAYQNLFQHDTPANEILHPRPFLGQALNGFHQELIQWKLGLRLPIDEPIGLAPYRQFTQAVEQAINRNIIGTGEFDNGEEAAWMTEPTNNFSPIRSGTLKLDRLRLVNGFGQVTEIDCDSQVIVPNPYRVSRRPGVAFLPPRLVQPARVTFRWLATYPNASDASVTVNPTEMDEATGQSPICGWLLPERLRRRLLVFDGEGRPLGAIAPSKDISNPEEKTLQWVSAPGVPTLELAKLVDQNPRLARVLTYLLDTHSPQFLDSFLYTLDDALANIDPEGAVSMGSLALLVGRPVAVVGAELNLELQGDPAIRQDWPAFMLDQHRPERDTDDFDHVQFRLRLGQYNSRNDAVLGYWQENPDGSFVDNTFVAQAANDNDPTRKLEVTGLNAKINAHDADDQIDDLNFTQSVVDPPLRVTLLMDPRGKAHLTTGILPVKSIDIPRLLWEPALEAIQVWFPMAPMLSRPHSRRVPIPTLVAHQWHWLETVAPGTTQRISLRPSLDRTVLNTQLTELQIHLNSDDPDTISRLIAQGWTAKATLPDIAQLLDKGWLKEQTPTNNRLDIGDKEDRQTLTDWTTEAPMETLLGDLSLALVSPGEEPDFTPGTEVREGWLLLEQTPDPDP